MMNSVMADVRDKSVFIMFSIVICVWKHCQVENVFVCYSVIRKKCITRNDDRKCIIKRKKNMAKLFANSIRMNVSHIFYFPFLLLTQQPINYSICVMFTIFTKAQSAFETQFPFLYGVFLPNICDDEFLQVPLFNSS